MTHVRAQKVVGARAHAPFHERPERENGFDERCGALRRVLDRGVRHVEEEVAHVDDHGVAVGHVRHFVPPVGEPVDCLGLGGACLEPFLEFRRPWRRAKLTHDGFAARIFGGSQMRTNGFEVFGESGGQRRYGEVGQRGLVSEHWPLLWVGFVPFWETGAARAGIRRPRLNDHGALFHGDWLGCAHSEECGERYRNARYVGERSRGSYAQHGESTGRGKEGKNRRWRWVQEILKGIGQYRMISITYQCYRLVVQETSDNEPLRGCLLSFFKLCIAAKIFRSAGFLLGHKHMIFTP